MIKGHSAHPNSPCTEYPWNLVLQVRLHKPTCRNMELQKSQDCTPSIFPQGDKYKNDVYCEASSLKIGSVLGYLEPSGSCSWDYRGEQRPMKESKAARCTKNAGDQDAMRQPHARFGTPAVELNCRSSLLPGES